MMIAAENLTARRVAPPLWGSFNGFAYVPRLPPNAYALFFHMLTQQEEGGLVIATHEELGAGLALDRVGISRAMPHLVAARLVRVVRRGRFQLHPMVAAFSSPKDQRQAVSDLPRSERLDIGHFEDEYERRLDLHQQEKARKAEMRRRVTAIPRRPQLKSVP
ncbi:hypothetical protein HRW16_31135 [Streptomyces lunaelactis]|uniref:hypothetical protein n=2 Tax=Streptomyces lunaelactis TaxID=1535768 RepID=UPI001584B1E7|nr:hypothetical protein [Streptomyces lunaelactis]NUK96202.1 hypothetical protein [Streptomyces lunaelactis]NUL32090.1 hypothetical protein [Streptomyces lunaelactis]